MVKGVSEGFVKKLEIQGVGFKAAVQGKIVNLSLGYSHPINYTIPDQIKVTVEENTKLTIEGPDKQVVGLVASEIRAIIRRSLTRAKVCATRTRRSSARKARPFNNEDRPRPNPWLQKRCNSRPNRNSRSCVIGAFARRCRAPKSVHA